MTETGFGHSGLIRKVGVVWSFDIRISCFSRPMPICSMSEPEEDNIPSKVAIPQSGGAVSDWFYKLVRYMGSPAFWVSASPVVLHANRARRRGAYILAPNHFS